MKSLVLIVVSAICVLGCGGAERKAAQPVERLSKPQYEVAVKALLAKAKLQNESVGQDDVTARLQAATTSLGILSAGLKALRPPAEVAAANQDFAAAVLGEQQRLRAYLDAIAGGDEAKAKAIIDGGPSEETKRKAEAYRSTFDRLGYDIGADGLP